mgnify:CR=1 FL=1
MNVYPEEIEEIIGRLPYIRSVVVKSKPHNILGEVPVAYIVKDRTFDAKPDDIMVFCREKSAHYKIPHEIIFIENIETTYNGKIKRGAKRS